MSRAWSSLVLLLAAFLMGSGYETSGGAGGGGAATDLTCVGCVDDAELANNYSGVGACGAGNYAQTLNDNAAPTCDDIDLTTDTVGNYIATAASTDSITGACSSEGCAYAPAFSYTNTLASNSLVADACVFTTNGILCEGSTANGFETALLFANTTTPDKTVTVPNETGTICTTGSVCTGYMASGADHGSLGGLTDDDHTQYTLKAGRSTTTNDTTISTDATGTIYGSTDTAGSLVIRANSTDLTTGEVEVNAPTLQATKLMDVGDDIADLSSSTANVIDQTTTVNVGGNGSRFSAYYWAPTMTISGGDFTIPGSNRVVGLLMEPTMTINASGIVSVYGVRMAGEIAYTAGAATLSLFSNNATFKGNMTPFTFIDSGIFTNAAGGTSTMGTYTSFNSNPSVTSSSGTAAITTAYNFKADLTMTPDSGQTSTVGTRYGLMVTDVLKNGVGTETLTNQYGVDVAALSGASTINVGMRNASTTVYTPTAQTLTAAGNTILPVATALNLTGNGVYTLSATPTITLGQDGQILIITNVGTNALTFQDASTSGVATALILTNNANVLLKQTSTLMLIYLTSFGGWLQIGGAQNFP